jgi:streptogramin lyase
MTGCAGFSGASFPDASTNPQYGSLGTISGSDFGGHAPLVGAHVYVLQPGTTGYGSQATSLLTANYQNNGQGTYNNTTQNTGGDPNIPSGWYYQTTDLTGAFNISGDYTCVVGQPVYLYLYGGSPTYPSANNTFNISSFNITGTSGAYTINFTIDTTSSNPIQNAYIGEGYTIHANGNASPVGHYPFDTSFQTVLASGLTTTTFSSSLGTTTTAQLTNGGISPNTTYNQTSGNMSVTFDPTFNSGVVNLAVLGNCPSGATDAGFGTSIKYVFVNEVATAAAATVFAPFTLSSNNDATHIGTPATTQAELGIANAALTAGNLYDIQGSSISTTYAGEGHIARPFTQNGNGIVPQSTLDTLGNILASCVDSNSGSTTVVTGTPTYGGNTNGTNPNISPQCNTLFTYATNTGVPTSGGTGTAGTQPYDIATAALNIARHPAGDVSNTSAFMSNLYSLPTGNPPFAPNLTAQPNDFGIGIYYPKSTTVNGTTVTNSSISNPESVSVDASGAVWIDDHGSATVYKYSPLGVPDFTVSYSASVVPTYTSLDPSGNDWVGVVAGLVTKLSTNGTFLSTGGTYSTGYTPYDGTSGYNTAVANGYSMATDGNGLAYEADANNTTGYRLTQYSAAGTATTSTYETNAIAAMKSCFGTGTDTNASGSPIRHVDHIAIDSKANGYNLWLSSEGFAVSGYGNICKINSSGNQVTGFTTSLKGIASTTTSDEFISIDSGGNAWVPSGYLSSGSTPVLLEISPSGGLTSYSFGSSSTYPFGSTIDGNNTVWVVDRASGTIANFNPNLSTPAFVSPSGNYKFSGSTSSLTPGGLNIAVDPSGNLWMTDYFNSNLVEVVGIAAPSVTPLSLAAKNNAFGTKP